VTHQDQFLHQEVQTSAAEDLLVVVAQWAVEDLLAAVEVVAEEDKK
jgi:hypothetical protein